MRFHRVYMNKIITVALATSFAITAMGGDNVTSLNLKLGNEYQTPKLNLPHASFINPNFNISPTINNYKLTEPLKLDFKISNLADSLTATPSMTASYKPLPSRPQYNFEMDPYSRDWSASGVITKVGDSYLIGSGGYTTYPGLGTIGMGSLGLTQTIDEKLTVTAGLTGTKYHMGRDAWNDYGIYGNASYRLNDRLSINAFGQYYLNQRYSSIAAMSYMQNSVYGGSLDIKISDNFGLDLGAQRYYDVYAHKWRTMPIIAPNFKLFGQPMSFDVGGLVYELLNAIIDKAHNHDYYGPVNVGASGYAPSHSPIGVRTRDVIPKR
jgi:hypothetical protein